MAMSCAVVASSNINTAGQSSSASGRHGLPITHRPLTQHSLPPAHSGSESQLPQRHPPSPPRGRDLGAHHTRNLDTSMSRPVPALSVQLPLAATKGVLVRRAVHAGPVPACVPAATASSTAERGQWKMMCRGRAGSRTVTMPASPGDADSPPPMNARPLFPSAALWLLSESAAHAEGVRLPPHPPTPPPHPQTSIVVVVFERCHCLVNSHTEARRQSSQFFGVWQYFISDLGPRCRCRRSLGIPSRAIPSAWACSY